MSAQKLEQQKKENPMREIRLEKVVLSCGATGADLDKARKLLEILSGKKVKTIKAGPKRRIPAFGVKPGLALGVAVTLRGEEAKAILGRLLTSVDNIIDEDQIAQNAFSFGIKEYIEIPGMEYEREIGIRGLNVTATFLRPGFRVKRKKIKTGKIPHKQIIQPEEIIKYLEENFETEVE